VADFAHRLLPEEPIADLEAYLRGGGGEGLMRALDLAPQEIFALLRDAGLRGRGGAGFPTGLKWASVADAAHGDPDATVYLVANAAEGEPGTYKDRALLLSNPYQFVEGLLIGLHAVGAEHGYVAIKRRFTAQIDRLVAALAEMAAAGWAGADRIEIATGPDEYLFGEEKAMLEVIEGKLPLPRIMPPYQVGLFGTMQHANPTLVNNVETFANVPLVVANGAEWYREVGTAETPGTMIFTVTGDVDAPGVYELPLGETLGTLITEIAGAAETKAVFSGVAQAVITPEMFEIPLGFDTMGEVGTGMGSGGYIVYDASRCIVKVMAALQHFLRIESCGQCPPCKLHTDELGNILERIDRGDGVASDLDELVERAAKVTDQNRCYLPVGSQLMVGSTLHRFGDEYADHLGAPCHDDRPVPVPKIEHLDLETGEVTFDERYHLKQPDWSYAEG
jgi:NADH-quinone oxidoreductase subunit F